MLLTTVEDNIWRFGSTELIALISAITTLAAVVVSLFLALKSKTIRYKVFVNNKVAGLRIINTGDGKFFVSAFGVIIDGAYYLNTYERIYKFLPESKQLSEHKTTNYEGSLGKVLLEPGDVVEVGLQYFDNKLFQKGKTYLFIMVSNHIKKYKLDVDKYDVKKEIDMSQYCKIEKNRIKEIGFYLGL